MKIAGFRRLLVLLATLALVPALSAFAAPGDTFPMVISLPDGFRPEGIAVGRGHTFYAGSLADGAIYGGDLRTGQGDLVVQGAPGRIAVGLAVDERSNYLFVAGGPLGVAYVYDLGSGAELKTYTLGGGFINDVVVTRDAAFFTNSFQPVLYRVPLGPRGALPDQSAVTSIPLGGDFVQGAGFNANGIDATPNGDRLLLVQSSPGTLYLVDPMTGVADAIELGGDAVPNGDGILLDGKTLYVMQNQLNQIAVVELAPDFGAGMVVRYITAPGYFDVPTTIAGFGDDIYAVNARFGIPPTSTTPYTVVRVSKH
jgi:hypothetical protein